MGIKTWLLCITLLYLQIGTITYLTIYTQKSTVLLKRIICAVKLDLHNICMVERKICPLCSVNFTAHIVRFNRTVDFCVLEKTHCIQIEETITNFYRTMESSYSSDDNWVWKSINIWIEIFEIVAEYIENEIVLLSE